MKYLMLILSVFSLFILSGCSDRAQRINPTPDVENANKFTEELAYKRGYEKAREELREVYIKKGFQIATEAFKTYERDIRAHQAGKYALKENLVTYPKIVSVDTGTGIKLKSLGCEIKDTLTPEEIMTFYAKYEGLVPKEGKRDGVGGGLNNAFDNNSNTMFLPQSSNKEKGGLSDLSGDGNKKQNMYQSTRMIEASNEDTKKIYQRFVKNNTFQDVISKYNLSCQDRDTYYLCGFKSQKSFDDFCKQSGQCQ